MKILSRSTSQTEAGNVLIILTFLLTGLIAVAGFSIDSAVYLLKRQELQSLAQSVAIAAAASLPNRTQTYQAAHTWYNILRFDQHRKILPNLDSPHDTMTVEFDDNLNELSSTNSYSVRSVSISIRHTYVPKIFPLLKSGIKIVGQAKAQIKPTDVAIIIDNSASWIEPIREVPSEFSNNFTIEAAQTFAAQCFAPPFMNLKEGALTIYDSLSQLYTVRTALVYSSSKTNNPYVFAQLGQTTFNANNLPYDRDEPASPMTRCACATTSRKFWVPDSYSNADICDTRTSLVDLISLQPTQLFSLRPNQLLLTREALWLTPAGTSTDSGFIHPRYFYNNMSEAIAVAHNILKNSKRADGLDVNSRVILILTDDAGQTPEDGDTKPYCDTWQRTLITDEITLGVVLLGHYSNLWGHNSKTKFNDNAIDRLRKSCNNSKTNTASFYLEVCGNRNSDEFRNKLLAQLTLAVKQVELRQ